MISRNLALLLVCSLSIASNGCGVTSVGDSLYVSRYINADQINAVVEEHSDATIPLETGDTISINLREVVRINEIETYLVQMVVTDVDATRVRGNLLASYQDREKNIVGDKIDIKLKDIEYIGVLEKRTEVSSQSDWLLDHPIFFMVKVMVSIGIMAALF